MSDTGYWKDWIIAVSDEELYISVNDLEDLGITLESLKVFGLRFFQFEDKRVYVKMTDAVVFLKKWSVAFEALAPPDLLTYHKDMIAAIKNVLAEFYSGEAKRHKEEE